MWVAYAWQPRRQGHKAAGTARPMRFFFSRCYLKRTRREALGDP